VIWKAKDEAVLERMMDDDVMMSCVPVLQMIRLEREMGLIGLKGRLNWGEHEQQVVTIDRERKRERKRERRDSESDRK
jgi:hypothetical protein